MRLLASFLLLVLISFQQQASPADSAKTGLEKHGTQTPTDETKNNISDNHQAITVNCSDVSKPTPKSEKDYAYDANKDPFYRWYLRGTVVGVAGAVVGVIILIRQTKALMDSERGWVVANAVGNPKTPLYDPANPRYTPGVVYLVEITGKTPAKIIRERFRCRIVPAIQGSKPPKPQLEKQPTYKSDSGMFDGAAMYPVGHKYQLSVSLESGPLSASEYTDLINGRTVLCVYGCIDYLDAFKRKGKTQVCAIYNFAFGAVSTSPDGTVLNGPGFRLGGPNGYNEVS